VEHFLDLVPHRLVILEVERREGADLEPALPFDICHSPALIPPHGRIFGERQDVLARQPNFVAQ
jgi:hypothetical protein